MQPPPSGPPGLRIAWLGAEPRPGGGVAGCAREVLLGLAELGCEIDCFTSGAPESFGFEESAYPGVKRVSADIGWRFGRWYSSHSLTKVFTGLACLAIERTLLARELLRRHEASPYDVVFQFSTIESFGPIRRSRGLPPLILQPEVHAAGELRWLRRERALARRCEPLVTRLLIDAMLRFRARRQRRDIRRASAVISISRSFGEQLCADYGVPRDRIVNIPNAIAVSGMRPATGARSPGPIRLVFVGRISVRKGIQRLVDLSHRLDDLAGDVTLNLMGDRTLWSDYRPLLTGLNENVARYLGPLSHSDTMQELSRADVLIHVPSYEPFGLVVGEALALGVPAVVTDAVGAAEGVSEECCTRVPADDVDALERAVRAAVERAREHGGGYVREVARREAERLFDPRVVAERTLAALQVAGRSAARTPSRTPD